MSFVTRPPEASPQRYVGLITRGIAFAIDAALINVAALLVSLGASLIASLFHFPPLLRTILLALGAAAYIVWMVGYFVVFWTSTGQTPGNRVLRIRVLSSSGELIDVRSALVRWAGMMLAALPFFAGFLLIPFSSKRRGLHDHLARTLVFEAPGLSLAQRRRESLVGTSRSSDDRGTLGPELDPSSSAR